MGGLCPFYFQFQFPLQFLLLSLTGELELVLYSDFPCDEFFFFLSLSTLLASFLLSISQCDVFPVGVSSQSINDGIKLLHSVALVSLLKPSPYVCRLVGFLPLLLLFSIGNSRAAELSQDDFFSSSINNYHIQQVTLGVRCGGNKVPTSVLGHLTVWWYLCRTTNRGCRYALCDSVVTEQGEIQKFQTCVVAC